MKIRRPPCLTSLPNISHVPARLLSALVLGAALLAGAALAATDEARDVERLWRGGEAAMATQRLDKALAARPTDLKLRFLKGVMLSEQKRDAEAIDIFQRLTEDHPDQPEPYNNLAVLHAGQGRIELARELLETALRHDSGYLAAHENLGDVFIALAQRSYEKAQAGGRANAGLDRKLRLARELASPPR